MEKQNETSVKNPEDAATVGMFLKYTRLNQKKTLDAVSKTLCIRKVYIKAIEDSNFEELAPVPYGIGFVRSYAEYLGLNSDRIVQCYKEEALPQQKEENSMAASVSTHKIMTKPNRRQILIGVAVVVCIYLVWLLAFCKSESVSEQNILPETESLSATEDLPPLGLSSLIGSAASNETPAKGQSLLTPPENTLTDSLAQTDSQIKITNDSYPDDAVVSEESSAKTDSRIVVKFKGESWFEIRDDEKIYITGVFENGYVYNVPNVSGLRMSVGRYYNVDVYIDGQLTRVARPRKQTNIALDPFLNH